MKNQTFKKLRYRLRHDFFTTNNLVVMAALFIAFSWAWGSVGMLERNYQLQREIYTKERQLLLTELEKDTLAFQQNYYKSDEYKELAVRQRLGLVQPGEKVLILPPNSKAATASDTIAASTTTVRSQQPSNFQQWMEFLFGDTPQGLNQ